ncbi:MAG: GHKL domain-containing protein [Clostridiales bacterium]|nr:GHKL domain-containing protein [Clostridiales bacterium]
MEEIIEYWSKLFDLSRYDAGELIDLGTVALYCVQQISVGLFLLCAGKVRRKWLLWEAVLLGCVPFLLLGDAWYELQPWRAVFYLLYYFLVIRVCSLEPPRRKLGLFGILLACMMAADTIASAMGALASGIGLGDIVGQGYEPGILLGTLLYTVEFMALGTGCLTFYNRLERAVRGKIIGLTLALAVNQNILMVAIFVAGGAEIWMRNRGWLSTLVSLTSIVTQYYAYQVIVSTAEATKAQQELEQLQMQREQTVKYYQLAQTSAKQMSDFRHDIKNQLQVAYGLTREDPNRAAGLLGELEERLDAIHPVRYCDDPTVNIILTVKADRAAEAGIRFDAQVGVSGWSLEAADLTSLFANLLDNAIEGCQRSGQPDPSVCITAGERQGFYLVKVVNTCGPEAGESGSSKGEGHGLGMNIIRAVARKYNGSFDTRAENGTFTAQVALEKKTSL